MRSDVRMRRALAVRGLVLALSVACVALVRAQDVAVGSLSFQGVPSVTDQEVAVPTLSFQGATSAVPGDVAVGPLSFQGATSAADGIDARLAFETLQEQTIAISPDGLMGVALRSARGGGAENLRRLDARVEIRAFDGVYIAANDGATLTLSIDEGPGRGWRQALPVRVPSISSGSHSGVVIPFTLRGVGVVEPGAWPTESGVNPDTYFRYVLLQVTLANEGGRGVAAAGKLGPFCYDAATMTLSPAQGCGAVPGQ